jgi:hypothetical protein
VSNFLRTFLFKPGKCFLQNGGIRVELHALLQRRQVGINTLKALYEILSIASRTKQHGKITGRVTKARPRETDQTTDRTVLCIVENSVRPEAAMHQYRCQREILWSVQERLKIGGYLLA